MAGDVHIRSIEARDEAVWRELWAGYLSFYEASLPVATTDATWARILDPDVPFLTTVAESDGEVGHIWFGSGLQRTPGATEAIFLLAEYMFDDLGYRRFEWKCNAANGRSRRAAERFGFSFEGVFRQHMVVKDRNRDTAWFAIIDRDWPVIRRAFQLWLDPANFNAAGQQKHSLMEIRSSLLS